MTVTEATWRSWAIPVYRILEAAGPQGVGRAQLAAETGFTPERVADVLWWLRARGVAIEYRIVGPQDARYLLGSRLPPAWEETVPAL